jgi:hypothetical protein
MKSEMPSFGECSAPAKVNGPLTGSRSYIVDLGAVLLDFEKSGSQAAE